MPDETSRLKCPTCGLIFIPDFDPETHSDAVKCPRCSSWLPFPLDKCILNRKPKPQSSALQSGQKSSFRPAESQGEKKSNPQQITPQDSGSGVDASTFFFGCAVIVFLIGQITAFVEDARPVVTIDLGVSAIVFLLMGIYFKLPKPK